MAENRKLWKPLWIIQSAQKKLEELAAGCRNAVIIASDHTRPVPSRIIMPALLKRLRQGNPDIRIKILIATGFHRPTTEAELTAKFGEEIVRGEEIIVHESGKTDSLVKIGTLPSGGELIVNKLAVETDLLISEGFIEPHFFAGYSGGRKSVLPGVASRQTVLANHCSEFIQSPYARTGILDGNPIHRDMVFAADAAHLAFICNVVIDHNKKVVKAFAGAHEAAHRAGCSWLADYCRIKVPESDIVITSNGGYPLDQNLYQSVKGMTAAEAVCRPGGVIIMCASCADGHGGESFFKTISEAPDAAAVWNAAKNIPRTGTKPDQWEYQIFARVLMTHTVLFVTKDCDHEIIRAMHLIPFDSLEKAFSHARKLMGEQAGVSVIPDGVSVISEKL